MGMGLSVAEMQPRDPKAIEELQTLISSLFYDHVNMKIIAS